MRKLNVLEFMSLDGVVQAPGGRKEDPSGGFEYGGWSTPHGDAAEGAAMKKQMSVPADLLLGRKTFQIFENFWPKHGDIWPGAQTATKYVASNTISSSEWKPNVFLNGDIAGKIKTLKGGAGPDLHVWGSANLVQTLLKHDLVDALWLKIFPVVLGKGKKLFAEGTIPVGFKVTESSVNPKGVIIINYERDGAVQTGDM
ncbi:MAG TPA: dihydrofolate reductase family protein [Candidatus Acidoferrales bacterium]